MVHEEKPVIFDVSQSMLTIHPMAPSLVERDIGNINYTFRLRGYLHVPRLAVDGEVHLERRLYAFLVLPLRP